MCCMIISEHKTKQGENNMSRRNRRKKTKKVIRTSESLESLEAYMSRKSIVTVLGMLYDNYNRTFIMK